MKIFNYLIIFLILASSGSLYGRVGEPIVRQFRGIKEFDTFFDFVKNTLEKKFENEKVKVTKSEENKIVIKGKEGLNQSKIINILRGLELIYIDDNKTEKKHIEEILKCVNYKGNNPDCDFILSLLEKSGEEPNVVILIQLFLDDCSAADNFNEKYDELLCSSNEYLGLDIVLERLVRLRSDCRVRLESLISRLHKERLQSLIEDLAQGKLPGVETEEVSTPSSTPRRIISDDELKSSEERSSGRITSFIENIMNYLKSFF